MKRRTWIVLLVVVLGLLIVLELTYFQFHTYFRSTEIYEELPTMTPGATPSRVIEGSFGEVDAIHKGSGTARIIEQDGMRYLRLEDFKVTSGPDLYVYLAESTTPGGTLESLGTYTDMGRLKATAGNQTYEIPSSATGRTVVIWCKRFGVLFTYAVMR